MKQLWQTETGIATLEWVALTAIVLMVLTGILVYFQQGGNRVIGQAASHSMQSQVDVWDAPFW